MKKFLVMCAVLMFALMFAACGGDNDDYQQRLQTELEALQAEIEAAQSTLAELQQDDILTVEDIILDFFGLPRDSGLTADELIVKLSEMPQSEQSRILTDVVWGSAIHEILWNGRLITPWDNIEFERAIVGSLEELEALTRIVLELAPETVLGRPSDRQHRFVNFSFAYPENEQGIRDTIRFIGFYNGDFIERVFLRESSASGESAATNIEETQIPQEITVVTYTERIAFEEMPTIRAVHTNEYGNPVIINGQVFVPLRSVPFFEEVTVWDGSEDSRESAAGFVINRSLDGVVAVRILPNNNSFEIAHFLDELDAKIAVEFMDTTFWWHFHMEALSNPIQVIPIDAAPQIMDGEFMLPLCLLESLPCVNSVSWDETTRTASVYRWVE
jgi:hypothetical protein